MVQRTWFTWKEVEDIADHHILAPHHILVNRYAEPKFAANHKNFFYQVTRESIEKAIRAKESSGASRSSGTKASRQVSVLAAEGLSSAPAQTVVRRALEDVRRARVQQGDASSSGAWCPEHNIKLWRWCVELL